MQQNATRNNLKVNTATTSNNITNQPTTHSMKQQQYIKTSTLKLQWR
jgi:hypothetical protein